MKKNESTLKIIFATFSNFGSGAFGDATNDRNLFLTIPNQYNKIALFPEYKQDQKITFNSIIKFLSNYLKEIVSSKKIIITRGPKLAILPILLKKIFRNTIIMRGGCTPLMFVERKAFAYNFDFISNKNLLQKLFYYFEPLFEKFTLRHADYFIVENSRSKRLISLYGANLNKIRIIPYYIQQYFIKGKNPDFNNNSDIFRVGYVGRFKEYDLIIPIIKAIDILVKNNFPIELDLIGDGPNRSNIERLTKEMNINKNIKFLGSKPHNEVSKIINKFHCLLLPMLNKLNPSTIAIKVLEGVMKGKIIITTNSGNNKSLFLNHTDLILEKPTETEIVEKIKLVFKNYNKYKEIAESLSKYHSNYRSKSISTEKINDLLKNITHV